MERVGAVVCDEMIGLAIQRELRAAYTIGEATGDRAEMGADRLILTQRPQAEHDIVEPPCPVRHFDLGDDATKLRKSTRTPCSLVMVNMSTACPPWVVPYGV